MYLNREFLKNEDVAKICATLAPNWDAAVNALIEASNKRWKEEEEVIDDITWYVKYPTISIFHMLSVLNCYDFMYCV